MNRKSIFLFNLKLKRFGEWVADLKAEKPGIIEFYLMFLMLAKILLYPRSLKQARHNYFQRNLTCFHCPIFDRELKRCRKGELGCGCYVPFKALAPADCWLRQQDGQSGWGLTDFQGGRVESIFQMIQKRIELVTSYIV